MRNNKTTAQLPLRADEASWILEERIKEVLPIGSVISNEPIVPVKKKPTTKKKKK